ncbi:MAG: TraB/GumN family protein [Planctomycetota bacterium]|nr:TraB/GumN family protein [Planctomycetota bacterium]
MNKWIKYCAIAALTIGSIFISCSEGAPVPSVTEQNPLLWKVTSENNTSYLFGTMHVADPRVTTLAPAVEAAFAASDAIFTELKESQVELSGRVTVEGRLPEGTHLSDLIPADMYAKINELVESNKMIMNEMNSSRPWMVGMYLQLIDAMPYMQGVALDMQLTNRAREEGKEVGGIETIDEQLAALAFGSEEEQIKLLGIAIDNMIEKSDNEISDIELMLNDYLQGDIDGLWEFANAELLDASQLEKDAFDALLTVRNDNMADRINKRIRANPESMTFYAFGALHFAGPQGVGELLKGMGYEVERVAK